MGFYFITHNGYGYKALPIKTLRLSNYKQMNKENKTSDKQQNGNDFIADVSARTSDYVCVDCGVKFLTKNQKEKGGVSTFHLGKCGLCGEEKSITHIRTYNYLYVR